MKQRLKSYKFWVALSGAVVIFVKALGQAFGFEVNAEVVDGIIMGLCGVLVAMGLVEKPASKNEKSDRIDVEKGGDVEVYDNNFSKTQNKE